MSIRVKRVDVSTDSINPELIFCLDVGYYDGMDVPFSFTGILKTKDGKQIAHLEEYINNRSERVLTLKTYNGNSVSSYRERERTFYVDLSAQLTNKAIEHIEKVREKDHFKDVDLDLILTVKSMNSKLNVEELISKASRNENIDIGEIKIGSEHANITIPQSEWVQKFAEPLGIGKFILLELQIPDVKQSLNEWKEIHERLLKHTQQMERQIKEGDWYEVEVTARRFMENLMPKGSENKEQFRQLFLENYYSDEGYNHLYKAIEGMFLYASKFIHDKDKQDRYNPIPVVKKEDAYLVYSLSISLTNLIASKISVERK